VKAHLKDGSMVEYPRGVTVTADTLSGEGRRHDLTRTSSVRVETIPLSEVIGMESYRTAVNTGQSVVVSTLASAGALFGGAALAVAIFGSCPTVYSGAEGVEEAEQAQSDSRGYVTLDIRNEAMETEPPAGAGGDPRAGRARRARRTGRSTGCRRSAAGGHRHEPGGS
jgi:hypothetical protein